MLKNLPHSKFYPHMDLRCLSLIQILPPVSTARQESYVKHTLSAKEKVCLVTFVKTAELTLRS